MANNICNVKPKSSINPLFNYFFLPDFTVFLWPVAKKEYNESVTVCLKRPIEPYSKDQVEASIIY